MNYNPNDARKTLEPGDYMAELVSCEETKSKAGKDMAVINWRIYPNDNSMPSVMLRDWVVIPIGVWKLEKMSKAWGVHDSFKDATFNPVQFIGHNLIVSIKVKMDEKYGEQNSIANYKPMQKSGSPSVITPALQAQLKRAEAESSDANFAVSSAVDDTIPF